jgi:hypothetical protein
MHLPTERVTQAADRYVVRPAGVLAELLGTAEMGEDEMLLELREAGLIAYPSRGVVRRPCGGSADAAGPH